MASRVNNIGFGEKPIRSQKYNAEINNIYQQLTSALTFGYGELEPINPTDGQIWNDSNYSPPLQKIWNTTTNTWQWRGVLVSVDGSNYPPEAPSKGAMRTNASDGTTEVWSGTAWIPIAPVPATGAFYGAGAYIWHDSNNVPGAIINPVIGYGFNVDVGALQTSSTAGQNRDIYVIGGSGRPLRDNLYYSMNAGSDGWFPVTGVDDALSTVTSTLFDENTVVEGVFGFDGDSLLPSSVTSTPFVFVIFRWDSSLDTSNTRYILAVRVTDEGSYLAGQAVKVIAIPSLASIANPAILLHGGTLSVGAADADGEAAIWSITWTDEDFNIGATPVLLGIEARITSLAYDFLGKNICGTLDNGNFFGTYFVANETDPTAAPTQETMYSPISTDHNVVETYYIEYDNLVICITDDGLTFEGTGNTTFEPPEFTQSTFFDADKETATDGILSGKRRSELIVGKTSIFGVEYGAVYERKLGSSFYSMMWQSADDVHITDVEYSGVRDLFLIVSSDPDTGYIQRIYSSDLKSVTGYFDSINSQLALITNILNTGMYKSGARKGEIRAWFSDSTVYPDGWALCDGAWNDEYGGNVPDLRGKFLKGGETYGATGGNMLVTLSNQNLPAHSHTINHVHVVTVPEHRHGMGHGHTATVNAPVGGVTPGTGANAVTTTGALGSGFVSVTVQPYNGQTSVASQQQVSTDVSQPETSGPVGSGTPINVEPPFNTVRWIIAIRDIAGVQGEAPEYLNASQIAALLAATEPSLINRYLTAADLPTLPRGATGISAYEQAVMAGFSGTVEQWLQSIRGSSGLSAYIIAVQNGYTGTEIEWLATLKGEPGDNAYSVAVDQGFTGDVNEWLASLQGQQGEPGASPIFNALGVLAEPPTDPGNPGDAYLVGTASPYEMWMWDNLNQVWVDTGQINTLVTPGPQGPSGKSAYMVAVEAGFTGTQAQWLASLKGQDGAPGGGGSTAILQTGFVVDGWGYDGTFTTIITQNLISDGSVAASTFAAGDIIQVDGTDFTIISFTSTIDNFTISVTNAALASIGQTIYLKKLGGIIPLGTETVAGLVTKKNRSYMETPLIVDGYGQGSDWIDVYDVNGVIASSLLEQGDYIYINGTEYLIQVSVANTGYAALVVSPTIQNEIGSAKIYHWIQDNIIPLATETSPGLLARNAGAQTMMETPFLVN